MSFERPNSIYDIAAMEKEHARFQAMLKEDVEALVKLYNIRNDNKGGTTVGTFVKDTEKSNTAIDNQVKLQVKLKAEVQAVEALMRQRFATDAKVITSKTDYAKATQRATVELQKQTKETKALAAAENAQVGTRDRAAAQIKLLTIQKDKLNLLNKDEAKQYDIIVAKIEKYNSFLKNSGTSAEKQRMNVGNYSGAIGILQQSLNEVSKKIEENTKAGKGNAETTKLLEKEYKILNQLVSSQAVGFASARAEILANQKALFQLEEAGKKGTKVYNDLAKATGNLSDQVGDLKARTKALGSDTFALDGLIQGAQTLAGAYGIAQGAAALFGEENEDLQKSMVKLQAIMTIIQGLQAIQNALQSESTIRLLIHNVQEKAYAGWLALKNFALRGSIAATNNDTKAKVANTMATQAATVATRALRIAFLALGIGTILVLLASAASSMGLFGSNTKDAAVSAEDLSYSMKNLNRELQDNIDKIKQQYALQQEILKQQGATQTALHNKTIEEMEAENAAIAKNIYYKLQALQGTERTGKAVQHLSKEQQNLRAEMEKNLGIDLKRTTFDVKSRQEAENMIEILSKSGTHLNEKQKELRDAQIAGLQEVADSFKKIEENKNEIALKNAQFKTKLTDEERERNKKYLEEQLKKEVDAENKKAQMIRAIQTENANEILRQNEKVAQDPANEINARLNAEKVAMSFRKILNEQEYQAAIASEVKIENGKKVVVEKSNAEKTLALTQYHNREKQIEENHGQAIRDIKAEDAEKTRAQIEKEQELELDLLLEGKEQEKATLEATYSNDIIALNDRFEKGKMSQKEYNKKREKLDLAYHIASLEAEVRYTKKVLEIMKLRGINVEKELRDLAKLELELSDLTRDTNIKNDKEVTDAKIANLEKLQQAYQLFSDTVSGFLNIAFTKQKNAIQDEIYLVDKRKENELRANDQRIQSDQDRAANAELINIRAQQQKEELERKQKQLDIKKAQAEKALSIFQITLATAVNVAKAVTPWGKILAAISGAAQLAIAIATPIPRYRGGRGYGKEEIAITGDGGVSEYIHREDGRIEKTPAKDTLVHLMPKDKVYKNKREMMDNLAAGAQDLSTWKVDINGGITRGDMEEFTGRIVQAVDKIEVNTMMITKSGWHQTNRRLAQNDAWVTKYIKGK